MAKRHDIDITISPKGEVHIEVKGIDGPRCLDITRELEEELGVVINREKKSEYYKEVNETGININNSPLIKNNWTSTNVEDGGSL